MNSIYIKTQRNNVFVKTNCVLCGEIFEPEDSIQSLYSDDNSLGYVCLNCNNDFENGRVDRINRHIKELNEYIAWLRDIKKQL